MPKGFPNPKSDESEMQIAAPSGDTEAVPAKSAAKMATITLTRNYRPVGEYEIVGHWLPKVEAKNAQGILVTIRAAEFLQGEPMPAPLSGVGTHSEKLWAGTAVRLPVDEARSVRRNNIGEAEIDD